MRVIKPQIFNPYEFSRPSPATFYGADGILELAGDDQLRLGYNPTTLEYIGPIIESEATNLAVKSNDFADDVWIVSGSTNSEFPETTPDGGDTAMYIKGGVSTNGSHSQVIDSGELMSGFYCFSLYVKGRAPSVSGFYTLRLTIESTSIASGVFSFDPDNYYALESFSGIEKLPNDWFRIWLYGPVNSAGTTTIRFSHTGSGSPQETYVWGAQFELGDSPTSFIYTDDSIETREADVNIAQSPSVIESNVEEDDAGVWDDGTTYSAGNLVMVLGQYHRVYESVGTNLNKFPPSNPSDWIDTGATNRWRMFDMNVGADKQSVANNSTGDIRVLLAVDEPVDSITLLNVDASSVRITVRDVDGNIVYDYFEETLTLPDSPFWWGFFFGNRRRVVTIVRLDLPPYTPVTIEVIAEGDANPAKIGKLIVGDAALIGCARYGTGVGIIDFSRKEQDAFGNYYVVERRFIGRCNYDIQVDSEQVDNVYYLLAEVRAVPCVYVGSTKYKSTVVFGFFRDFDVVISGPRKSACSLQVQGI